MDIVDIYCRVSTTAQAEEGYSIEEQQTLLKKYAEAHGWAVNNVLVDGGYSGKNMERPGLQALLRDVKAHRINRVLVYKMDRLSRSQKEMLYLIEDEFIPNKISFVSMTENLDTSTALGIAMIGIMAAFAQLERSQITERMMMGRTARAKEGYYHGGGSSPMGYDYDKATNQLVVNEADAYFVRMIFDLYASGETANNIAKRLNLEYGFRGRKTWGSGNVTRMLRNPIYCGLLRWKGDLIPMNEGHVPLISKELYYQVQSEIQRRCAKDVDRPQTPYKHKTLLGGLVWCGKCGRRYTADKDRIPTTRRELYRYYCVGRRSLARVRGFERCENLGWKADDLNNAVLDEIRKLATDRSLVCDIEKREAQHADERNAIKARIAEIDKQYDRLIDLFALGKFDSTAIAKRTDALTEEKQTLEEKLQSMQPATAEIATINEQLDTFSELIDSSNDIMVLYPIVHNLIKSITLDDDNISIVWNF